MKPVLFAAALTCQASAAFSMSAAEFDARVTGKTIYYNILGVPSGIEEYRTDRRARWMDADGECVDGTWFEENGTICFDYPDYGPVQCWHVLDKGGQLHAYKVGTSPMLGFISYREDTKPLPCRAPNLGM